jgi:hypothetical protein
MEHLTEPLLEFIKAHQNWAIAIMFITAFGESFAFLSLLFPGTTLLIAAGTLIALLANTTNGRNRRFLAVDPPLRRQTGVAPIEPAANGRSTIYT